MPRLRLLSLAALLCACATTRTPDQLSLLQRKNCDELLRSADGARAAGDPLFARELASACPQEGLDALVNSAPTSWKAFLWCGRARAALVEGKQPPSCDPEKIRRLTSELRPLLTLGPADPESPPDAPLKDALDEIGPELHLSYDHEDPVVFMGMVRVAIDRSEWQTLAVAAGPDGRRHQIPATLHRVIARAEAQVELGSKTRTVHASEEVRDTTWDPEPRFAIQAHLQPQLEPEQELKRRAVQSLVRTIARSLASNPPESLDIRDAPSCLAYGLAIAVATGDRNAAATGVGDDEKVANCEKLLGLPVGAGIPIP
jgi:hypothetical protein